ncbi:hypothetical protein ACNPQN_32825 [Streptomyces sp. NPDC056297]|uniref:hypothetical protein n=1 Tax=unclassified Streptomyces TaxID=2593676 RepID=UPI0035D90669
MNQPPEASEPSYTKIEMSGSPEAVAQLMAALSGVGEVIFDHRSTPNTRGDVVCTARVATFPSPGPDNTSRPGEAVVQSTLSIAPDFLPALSEQAGSEKFEAAAAAALTALDGVHAVRSRLVAVSLTGGLGH